MGACDSPLVLLLGHVRLLDHEFSSLALARKACDSAGADSKKSEIAPPPRRLTPWHRAQYLRKKCGLS